MPIPATSAWNLAQYLAAMPGWSERDFQTFRDHVATQAATHQLDTYAHARAQDPVKWKALVNDCVQRFPALADFEQHWPIEAYFSKYAARRHYYRTAQAKLSAARSKDATSSTQQSQGRKRKERESDKENEQTPPNAKQPASQNIKTPQNTHTPAPASQHTSQNTPTRAPAQPEARSKPPVAGHDVPVHKSLSSSNQIGSSTSASVARHNATSPLTRKDSFPSSQLNCSASAPSSSAPFPASSASSSRPSQAVISVPSSQLSYSTSAPSSSPHFPASTGAPRSPQAAMKPKHCAHWGPCIFCGFQPAPIPGEEIAELQRFFKGRDDLHQVFAAVGVVTDRHFRAFINLSERKREAFLGSVTPAYFTYVEKVEVVIMLEAHDKPLKAITKGGLAKPKLECEPAAAKVQVTEIPRPPGGLENLFSNHLCKYTHIKKHMRVSDDDEYFDLVLSLFHQFSYEYIESRIPRFLDVCSPMEEQDEDQLEKLVKSVCENEPSMRRYVDCWPVHMHIKRFLSARATGLPGTQRTAPPTHECQRQRTHPVDKVPPSVVAVLADYGMEELGPAFLFLGIHTDDKFTEIFTSQNAKTRLLADLPRIGGSLFQVAMMKHIIAGI
ncbi:hypothetical protein C8R44DRAFT_991932 [Mycena epipterygia]|nr:hypothetical protein C8R44DRAFT_991932 [Mycena epipterygia]